MLKNIRYRDKEVLNGNSEQKFEIGHFKSENVRFKRFLIVNNAHLYIFKIQTGPESTTWHLVHLIPLFRGSLSGQIGSFLDCDVILKHFCKNHL